MPVSCSVSQSVPSGMYFINSPAIKKNPIKIPVICFSSLTFAIKNA